MTHQEQLVSDIIAVASPLIRDFLNLQPEESRQRLDGLQQILDALVPQLEVGIFEVLVGWLSDRAEFVAGTCRICGNRARRETKRVKVKLKRFSTTVEVVRFRCRSCKTSRSPVREWLGLQSGMTSAGLDRAVTALSTEMSFGRAAQQMEEQHGHAIDRTLIERRTYAVGEEAMEFLEERRQARRDEVMDAVGHRHGVDRVLLQVDGGGVPVGQLERPKPEETTERTPVRNLPKGRRPKTKREVRVCMAWEDGDELGSHRCVDGGCVNNDAGECAVRAARRYLKKHGEYMDYPRFIDEELPIGSGAVEGRIRHIVRRRLDVPGDWREKNLHPLLALISIRESGLWDAFWEWIDDRDRARFRQRLRGEGLNKFRGHLPVPEQYGHATERLDLDSPFDPHYELGLPTVH